MLLAMVVSAGACAMLIRVAPRFSLMDFPGRRSLHSQATPRVGGIAVLLGTVLAILWDGNLSWPISTSAMWVVAAFAVVFLVSLADDMWNVSPAARLVCHIIAVGLIWMGGWFPEAVQLPGGYVVSLSPWFGIPAMVWMINLYNFMDGMDGLAGGMTVIGFSVFALFGLLAGIDNYNYVLISGAVASAAMGFLLLNFPPAKVFLGDAGASSLGFFAGFMCLWGQADGIVPIWIGVLVFSPFIADSSVTVLIRAVRGQRIWLPHREHFYQRLALSGWGRRKSVLFWYLLMFGVAVTALFVLNADPIWELLAVLIWLVIFSLSAGMISWISRRREIV